MNVLWLRERERERFVDISLCARKMAVQTYALVGGIARTPARTYVCVCVCACVKSCAYSWRAYCPLGTSAEEGRGVDVSVCMPVAAYPADLGSAKPG